MPTRRVVDLDRVRALLRQGLTHREIAQVISEETGERVTREAVSVALHRAGDTASQPRYEALIPWRVRVPHMRQYPVIMLRALGRREAGGVLPDDLNRKLNLWLARLVSEGLVVDYDPESGFSYVPRQEGEVWIRQPGFREALAVSN